VQARIGYNAGMKRWRFTLKILLIATLLPSAGCGSAPQDVTRDPAYGNFGAVMGTWKTKAPIQLVECSEVNIVGGDRFLGLGGALKMGAPGEKVLADLPAGTEIRIEHLIFAPSWEASLLGVTGSLTAGSYADRQAQLDPRLFTGDIIATIQQTHGDRSAINTTWTVDPSMLEK
jgi:hypothetical protein